MEVKRVYLDLHEWVKRGNTWELESEAFKDPLKLEIWFDSKDREYIDWVKKEIENKSDSYDNKLSEMKEQLELEKRNTGAFELMLSRYEEVIKEYELKLLDRDKELKELYKVVADQKSTIETLSWAMLSLQESVKLLQKKSTKQPIVIHDKCFISGHEPSWLWFISIPNGDYLLISKYMVWEHNEYVTNTNDLIFDKIHVSEDHYVPFYKLEWGTPLDTPTATIYYDLIFMPI